VCVCVCVCGGREGKRDVVSNLRLKKPDKRHLTIFNLVTPYNYELQNILN